MRREEEERPKLAWKETVKKRLERMRYTQRFSLEQECMENSYLCA
jgi:hypothetical protein